MVDLLLTMSVCETASVVLYNITQRQSNDKPLGLLTALKVVYPDTSSDQASGDEAELAEP